LSHGRGVQLGVILRSAGESPVRQRLESAAVRESACLTLDGRGKVQGSSPTRLPSKKTAVAARVEFVVSKKKLKSRALALARSNHAVDPG